MANSKSDINEKITQAIQQLSEYYQDNSPISPPHANNATHDINSDNKPPAYEELQKDENAPPKCETISNSLDICSSEPAPAYEFDSYEFAPVNQNLQEKTITKFNAFLDEQSKLLNAIQNPSKEEITGNELEQICKNDQENGIEQVKEQINIENEQQKIENAIISKKGKTRTYIKKGVVFGRPTPNHFDFNESSFPMEVKLPEEVLIQTDDKGNKTKLTVDDIRCFIDDVEMPFAIENHQIVLTLNKNPFEKLKQNKKDYLAVTIMVYQKEGCSIIPGLNLIDNTRNMQNESDQVTAKMLYKGTFRFYIRSKKLDDYASDSETDNDEEIIPRGVIAKKRLYMTEVVENDVLNSDNQKKKTAEDSTEAFLLEQRMALEKIALKKLNVDPLIRPNDAECSTKENQKKVEVNLLEVYQKMCYEVENYESTKKVNKDNFEAALKMVQEAGYMYHTDHNNNPIEGITKWFYKAGIGWTIMLWPHEKITEENLISESKFIAILSQFLRSKQYLQFNLDYTKNLRGSHLAKLFSLYACEPNKNFINHTSQMDFKAFVQCVLLCLIPNNLLRFEHLLHPYNSPSDLAKTIDCIYEVLTHSKTEKWIQLFRGPVSQPAAEAAWRDYKSGENPDGQVPFFLRLSEISINGKTAFGLNLLQCFEKENVFTHLNLCVDQLGTDGKTVVSMLNAEGEEQDYLGEWLVDLMVAIIKKISCSDEGMKKKQSI